MRKRFCGGAVLLLVVLRLAHGKELRGGRDTLMRALPSSVSGNTTTKRALIIDTRGPTRGTGDGLRLMAMVMDLAQADCDGARHFVVDILSDAPNATSLTSSWSPAISRRYLASTRFFGMAELLNGTLQFDAYDNILIGYKLDLLRTYSAPKSVVTKAIELLQWEPDLYRALVSVFWDDVPFERCQIRPQAEWVCGQMPLLVSNLSSISSRFYTITDRDHETMENHMAKLGIGSQLNFSVWPMRIQNMAELLPEERFMPEGPIAITDTKTLRQKDLVIMLGNGHQGNLRAIQSLFRSGAIREICRAIKERRSLLKVSFLGGLAAYALTEMKALDVEAAECVNASPGYVSDEELNDHIMPRTRAILNPLFEDLNSGISVKNHEALMSYTPSVTTRFALHGLDETPGCDGLPFPDPREADDFVDFFVRHVVEDPGYCAFVSEFRTYADKCKAGQEAQLHGIFFNLCGTRRSSEGWQRVFSTRQPGGRLAQNGRKRSGTPRGRAK